MKIAFIGDIAFIGKCSTRGNMNIDTYFLDVAKVLSEYDLVIGNLETPFSIRKKTYGAKSAYICADAEDVRLLGKLNVGAVSLANNHIYDFGREGVELTERLLKENGIEYFGINGRELKYERNGNRLALSGFCCYSTNPLRTVPYGENGVNEFNVRQVCELLSQNVKDGYLNIISVHAGIEHVNYPSYDSINIARYLSDIAPYIYYGHHPHVAQGIEICNDSLIAYSLGNFCFDDVYSSVSNKPLVKLSENNRSSFILEVEIVENEIKSHKTIPIYIGEDKLHVNLGTTEADLQKYTEAIQSEDRNEYIAIRKEIIAGRQRIRSSERDLMWFLKRLTPRYFKLIITNRINKYKYRNRIKI